MWRAAALCFGLTASIAAADTITGARFIAPTQHYKHGVLGDDVEYGGMVVDRASGRPFIVGFAPGTRVFEDVAPRLWDVTGDDAPEVVVVETNPAQGAQLAIYGLRGDTVAKIAGTPHIGQRNRWLAPIGAADFDGDGHIEVAYIDRPHLAKTLRIWRYHDGALSEIASLPGLTNHRIGERDIGGGLRTCEGVPQMVVASADWARVMVVAFTNGAWGVRDAGPHRGRASLDAARACR